MLAATGNLARADALLKALTTREPTAAVAPSVRAWALWLLADFADRAGDASAAEAQLRAALEADPQSEGIRSALSDLLLDRGAYREALALVDLPAPSIGLLARRARAQQLLHDSALRETRSQIYELVSLASRRGDRRTCARKRSSLSTSITTPRARSSWRRRTSRHSAKRSTPGFWSAPLERAETARRFGPSPNGSARPATKTASCPKRQH